MTRLTVADTELANHEPDGQEEGPDDGVEHFDVHGCFPEFKWLEPSVEWLLRFPVRTLDRLDEINKIKNFPDSPAMRPIARALQEAGQTGLKKAIEGPGDLAPVASRGVARAVHVPYPQSATQLIK